MNWKRFDTYVERALKVVFAFIVFVAGVCFVSGALLMFAIAWERLTK